MIDETSIRERAYALWEKDACPEGASKFYWHLARVQLEAQAEAKNLNARIAVFESVEAHNILVTHPS